MLLFQNRRKLSFEQQIDTEAPDGHAAEDGGPVRWHDHGEHGSDCGQEGLSSGGELPQFWRVSHVVLVRLGL